MALAFYQNAYAQTGQAASLEKHCDDIKMVFDLAKDAEGFTSIYWKQLGAFFEKRCVGAIPLPTVKSDIQVFNTSSRILYSGAKIVLIP